MQDDQQILRLIKIEAMDDAEPRTERRSDQTGAGGGADQGEVVQVKWVNARSRSLSDDQVHAKILHRGVEDFLDRGLQTVNFVEEKHFAGFQRGKNRRQIAFAIEQRAGAGLDWHVQFVGDDLRESGFSKAGRTVEQNMVQRFTAVARSFQGDRNIFFDTLLADIFA